MSTTTYRPTAPIVVGVDSRPGMRHVLEWAAREAVLRGAPLTLVHAVGRDLDLDAIRPGEDVGAAISRATLDAGRVLDEATAVVQSVAPSVTVERQVSLDSSGAALRHSVPAPALVVVGSRSHEREHSTLDDLEPSLGHELRCPVIAVAGPRDASGVLALADGTVWSVPALTAAFEEADLRGTDLTVALVLADPFASAPAQDLRLMDETARIEAAAGPSSLGFQRTLLVQQVQSLRERFPAVVVRLVTADDEVDRLLDGTSDTAAYVVADSAHVRRIHQLTDHAVTMIVPSDRPDDEPEIPDLQPEIRQVPERVEDLESWWDRPTVDEPQYPALVRVRVRRHHLRRRLEP